MIQKIVRYSPVLLAIALLALLFYSSIEDKSKRLPYIAAAQSLRESSQHLDEAIRLIVNSLHNEEVELSHYHIPDSLKAVAQSINHSMHEALMQVELLRAELVHAAGVKAQDDLPLLATLEDFDAPSLDAFEQERTWVQARASLRQLQQTAQHVADVLHTEFGISADSVLRAADELPINERLSNATWLRHHFAYRSTGEAILLTYQWEHTIYAHTYAVILKAWEALKLTMPKMQRYSIFYEAQPQTAQRSADPNFMRVGDTLLIWAWLESHSPKEQIILSVNGKEIPIMDGVGYYTPPVHELGKHKFWATARVINPITQEVRTASKSIDYYVAKK